MIDDIIIGAMLGCLFGAATAAISGSDIGMGGLTGAIGGALFGAAGGIINNSLASAAQAAEMTMKQAAAAGLGMSTAGQVGLHAAAGAVSGGINAGITGGDVGLGMLSGGVSGGIGKFLGGIIPNNPIAQAMGRPLVGGITAGIATEIGGGRFGDGFTLGMETAAIGLIANDWEHVAMRAEQNRQMTDEFFDSWMGKLSKLAVGPITKLATGTTLGTAVTSTFGTIGLSNGINSLFNDDMDGIKGLACFGGAAGTVRAMAFGLAVSAAVGYVSFNGGLYIGSYVEALPEYFK